MIVAVVMLQASSKAADADPTNFIVIIADDMAWNDCGAYGHPSIHTPNIDQMATEGMRFDRAFLTCSSCSPSRCSIMTGRYPHATGAAELHMPLPAEQVMFTMPLRQAGYYTAQAGKWHMGKDAESQFDKLYMGGGPSGCENWLKALRERPMDKPFFMWLASFDPHRGYKPNTFDPPHRREDVVVPPFLPDEPEVRDDLAMYYDEIARLDSYIGKVFAELKEQGVDDNTCVIFISDNGRPFPRCKTLVVDSGVRTPFIVRWPDRVKAGSTCDSLVSSVDIAPTIVDLAGAKTLDSFQGVSFAPLLKDPRQTVRQFVFSEHNWHDYEAYERSTRNERYLYTRNWRPKLTASPPADAVNSPTYRKMLELHDAGKLPPKMSQPMMAPQPPEQLFDVVSDPYQMNNLADDPQHADTLKQMRRVMDDWRQRTGDELVEPLTPDWFDRRTGKKLGKGARPTGR
ncbi:sulfatase [Planctomycetales bacterium ZRK34]|nr:sulfatase [Planctomycetales bacterium ZRK34]